MKPSELISAVTAQRDQMINELAELDGKRDQLKNDIAKLTFFINRCKEELRETENHGKENE